MTGATQLSLTNVGSFSFKRGSQIDLSPKNFPLTEYCTSVDPEFDPCFSVTKNSLLNVGVKPF